MVRHHWHLNLGTHSVASAHTPSGTAPRGASAPGIKQSKPSEETQLPGSLTAALSSRASRRGFSFTDNNQKWFQMNRNGNFNAALKGTSGRTVTNSCLMKRTGTSCWPGCPVQPRQSQWTASFHALLLPHNFNLATYAIVRPS